MLVRLATRLDIPHLVELMREFYAESSFPLDGDWAARAFADLIDEPGYGAVWIIEKDGTPVGHIVLSVRFAMEFGGLSGYIDDLFVRPEYRRKGAANAAVKALFSECKRRGCRAVQVEVGLNNHAANALYDRYELIAGEDQRQTLRAVFQPED